jgi:hypothetical protein
MGKAARTYAQKAFSIERMADGYLRLFAEVCTPQPS